MGQKQKKQENQMKTNFPKHDDVKVLILYSVFLNMTFYLCKFFFTEGNDYYGNEFSERYT